jgi:hypothetical protein
MPSNLSELPIKGSLRIIRRHIQLYMTVKYIINALGKRDMETCIIMYHDNVRRRGVGALGTCKVKFEIVYKLSVIRGERGSFR